MNDLRTRPRPRAISHHTQALILTYARRGWTVQKIARSTRCHKRTVARCLVGWGVVGVKQRMEEVRG